MEIVSGIINWFAEDQDRAPEFELIVGNIPSMGKMRFKEEKGFYYANEAGRVEKFRQGEPDADRYPLHITVMRRENCQRMLKPVVEQLFNPQLVPAYVINELGLGSCVDVTMRSQTGHEYWRGAVTELALKRALKGKRIRMGKALGEKFEKGARAWVLKNAWSVWEPVVKLGTGRYWAKGEGYFDGKWRPHGYEHLPAGRRGDSGSGEQVRQESSDREGADQSLQEEPGERRAEAQP